MSMFDQEYVGYRFRNCEMPSWARAERYEYCESLYTFDSKPAKPAKRKAGLFHLMLSAFAGLH